MTAYNDSIMETNILLVDDRPENLLALEALLENMTYNLVLAHSGAEALKQVLELDFAVILLDVQMADMDGFETAALIKDRERSQHTPIIFITALSYSSAHVFKGYSVGAVDYLVKPIIPEILQAKVAAFVELFIKTEEVKQQADYIESANKVLQQQLQQIKQLNHNLEIVNHELESFSYSVSHDLRAPLRSISGFSQALLQDYHDQLDPTGQGYLSRIYASSQRMGELIDDLLKLSRLSTTPLKTKPVQLSEIVAVIAENLAESEPEREVKFIVQEGVIAQGDERLLRVLLENLLNNAWKFTGKHASAEIEFGVISQNGQPVYFVRDDGAGFDMAYENQLFSVFQRLHDEDEFEGHGIGLATSQRIIHRHGGRIWAESVPEQGATFFFTL
jgi:two-component system, sensor histidine kinase and response regulator